MDSSKMMGNFYEVLNFDRLSQGHFLHKAECPLTMAM